MVNNSSDTPSTFIFNCILSSLSVFTFFNLFFFSSSRYVFSLQILFDLCLDLMWRSYLRTENSFMNNSRWFFLTTIHKFQQRPVPAANCSENPTWVKSGRKVINEEIVVAGRVANWFKKIQKCWKWRRSGIMIDLTLAKVSFSAGFYH